MSIWGKIIGGTAGFALGGPLGAILGVMAGNIYDRSKKTSYKFHEIPNQQKQSIFALSVIILAAKLAKADGVVTKDEIEAFKEKFRISSTEMEQVGKIFNEAKKTSYGFEKIAQQVGSLFQNNHVVLEELLNDDQALLLNQFINKYYDSLFKKTVSPFYMITGRHGITDNYATQAIKLKVPMNIFISFCSTVLGLYRDNFDKNLLENYIK